MLRRLLLAFVLGMTVLGITACNGPTTKPTGSPDSSIEETYQSSPDVGDTLYKAESPPVLVPQPTEGQKLVDPIVIPDCRLTVFEKQDVPANKDGTLLFLGTEATPEELAKLTKDQIVVAKINGQEKKFRRLDRGDFVKENQLLGILFDQLARDDVSIKDAKKAVAVADREAAFKTKDEAMARYRTQEKLYGTGGLDSRKLPATSQEDLRAAKLLAESSVEASLLHVHTVKPLDEDAVRTAASNCELLVTVEEHSKIAGLGSAVSDVLAEAGIETPQLRLAFPDEFIGTYGSQDSVLQAIGLDPPQIAQRVLKRLSAPTAGSAKAGVMLRRS